MSPKFLITAGLIAGTTIGSFVPALWGDSSFFSFSSAICTFIGGLAGVWAGFKLGQMLD